MIEHAIVAGDRARWVATTWLLARSWGSRSASSSRLPGSSAPIPVRSLLRACPLSSIVGEILLRRHWQSLRSGISPGQLLVVRSSSHQHWSGSMYSSECCSLFRNRRILFCPHLAFGERSRGCGGWWNVSRDRRRRGNAAALGADRRSPIVATPLARGQRDAMVVLRDPEGNEFCLG